MGRQARGPSGAGRGLAGRQVWRGPHLSSTRSAPGRGLSPQVTPLLSCAWSLEGGWVDGEEVVSLGLGASCAEAHPASPTKGDRLLPCLISNLPTNVCGKKLKVESIKKTKVLLTQSCLTL